MCKPYINLFHNFSINCTEKHTKQTFVQAIFPIQFQFIHNM